MYREDLSKYITKCRIVKVPDTVNEQDELIRAIRFALWHKRGAELQTLISFCCLSEADIIARKSFFLELSYFLSRLAILIPGLAKIDNIKYIAEDMVDGKEPQLLVAGKRLLQILEASADKKKVIRGKVVMPRVESFSAEDLESCKKAPVKFLKKVIEQNWEYDTGASYLLAAAIEILLLEPEDRAIAEPVLARSVKTVSTKDEFFKYFCDYMFERLAKANENKWALVFKQIFAAGGQPSRGADVAPSAPVAATSDFEPPAKVVPSLQDGSGDGSVPVSSASPASGFGARAGAAPSATVMPSSPFGSTSGVAPSAPVMPGSPFGSTFGAAPSAPVMPGSPFGQTSGAGLSTPIMPSSPFGSTSAVAPSAPVGTTARAAPVSTAPAFVPVQSAGKRMVVSEPLTPDIETEISRINTLIGTKKINEALTAAEALFNDNKNVAAVNMLLGTICASKGMFLRAFACLSRAYNRASKDAKILLELGRAFWKCYCPAQADLCMAMLRETEEYKVNPLEFYIGSELLLKSDDIETEVLLNSHSVGRCPLHLKSVRPGKNIIIWKLLNGKQKSHTLMLEDAVIGDFRYHPATDEVSEEISRDGVLMVFTERGAHEISEVIGDFLVNSLDELPDYDL